jgi:GNAT superfamily N-acetyltransferase
MLRASTIRYTTSLGGITPEMLSGFFVGWPNPPSAETHLCILQRSSFVVLAIDQEATRVIGFITAISDGIMSAYITLLEVLPDHQRKGIGTELLTRMLAQFEKLYMVDTICDDELRPFYSQFGMQPSTGMRVRNYERQSGVVEPET